MMDFIHALIKAFEKSVNCHIKDLAPKLLFILVKQ